MCKPEGQGSNAHLEKFRLRNPHCIVGRESRKRKVGEEIDESGLIFFQARRELSVYSGGIATMVCQRSRLRKKGNEDLEKREVGEG